MPGRKALAMLVLLAAVAACAMPTTFVVVRHAEKAKRQGRDPDLTAVGRARAQALLAEVADRSVAAVYHTPYRRTLQTVEPVAERFGLTPIEVPYEFGEEPAHADAVVTDALRRFPGMTVVYAGHTTTVPAMLRRLGIDWAREIPESEYDNLFIVIVKGESARLEQRRYGAPSR